jgi:hypothetical protein
VVGADGGGVPELLDAGRCGALFPRDDPTALCRQLELIFAQPKRREEYAVKGRQRALSLFRSDRVASDVAAVWDAVFDADVYRRRRWAWMEDACAPRTRRSTAGARARELPVSANGAKREEAIPAAK